MAKKMYVSPLFSGGLVDGGDHTEPYTNSQETYSPDSQDKLYPDFSGLNEEQILEILSMSREAAWALDADGNGVITADEYPSASYSEPE